MPRHAIVVNQMTFKDYERPWVSIESSRFKVTERIFASGTNLFLRPRVVQYQVRYGYNYKDMMPQFKESWYYFLLTGALENASTNCSASSGLTLASSI